MIFLSENGFSKLAQIKNESVYGFNKLNMTEEKLKSRVNFVCEYFRNQIDRNNSKKKRTDKQVGGVVQGSTNGLKKVGKHIIPKDVDGNIQYPIHISASLRLVSPGSRIVSRSPREAGPKLPQRTQPVSGRV